MSTGGNKRLAVWRGQEMPLDEVPHEYWGHVHVLLTDEERLRLLSQSAAIWRGQEMPRSEVAKRVPPEHWDEVRVLTPDGGLIRYHHPQSIVTVDDDGKVLI